MSQLFCRERRSWTAKEDQLLRDAVQREDPDNANPSKWHAIAKHVPNRTNKDCRKRWFAKMASDVVKGGWAPDEDEKLVKGIERYGTRWSLVASVVQTRNSDQCAKRWTDTLNPSIDRTTWTPEADEMLLRAVTEHGKVWTKIVKTYFPGRTGLSAKNRYNSITRFSSDLSRSVRPRRKSEGGTYLPDRKTESVSSSSSCGSPASPSMSPPFLSQSPAQPSLNNRTHQHPYLEPFSDWSSSSSMTTEDIPSLRSSPIAYDFSTNNSNNLDNSYQSFDISMPSYPPYPDSSLLLFSEINNTQASHNNLYKTLSNPSHNHNQMHTPPPPHPTYPHYPHLAGSLHGTTEGADRFPTIYDAIPALESGPVGNFGVHSHLDMAWGLTGGSGGYGMKVPGGYGHGHHGYAVRSRS